MVTRAEALQILMGPNGPFETVDENVLDETMPVFRHRHRSLRALLDRSAEWGRLEAVAHDGRTLTFEDHHGAVGAAAVWLSETHGIGPGSRVAILGANSIEWMLTFWATVSLGGIVVALNGWWTADEIRHGLDLTEPHLIVGDTKRLSRLAGIDVTVPVVDFADVQWWESRAPLPDVPLAEDDPALILFTSGTTGRSKGATVSHRGLVGFVQSTLANGAARAVVAGAPGGGPRPQTVTLVTAPMFHVSGLMGAILMNIATGGKMVLRSGRFDPEDVLRRIDEHKVTSWGPLGDMAPRVLAVPSFGDHDVSSVTMIGLGGAPVRPDLVRRLREAFPNAKASASMGYGSSETVSTVASIGGQDFIDRPTSTGQATPTVELEIREGGELYVRSAYTMLGYWNDPGATADAILEGRWLATGDIGRLDDDGFLYIDSRARDMILRGAENVYPIEVEQRIDAHPHVAEVAVLGVDHPTLGQEVKAIVVPEAGIEVDTVALADWTAETLAAFKVPTHWEIRSDPLPRTETGKVRKRDLAD